MTFFSTIFLWALASLAVPILIALWNRKKFKTIRFGAFYLLKRLHESQKRRLRLLEILKLLNRLALISLLVLLFAEPFRTEMRVGDAEEGFALLIDVSRNLQLPSDDGSALSSKQLSKVETILNHMPAQAQGMVFFVAEGCNAAQVGQFQTAKASEWRALLDQDGIPYQNSQLSQSAIQSCFSKAAALFSGRKLYKVFVGLVPSSLDLKSLQKSDLMVEALGSPLLEPKPSVVMDQESADGALKLSLNIQNAPGAPEGFLIERSTVEPLGSVADKLTIAAQGAGFLLLKFPSLQDPWKRQEILPLKEIRSRSLVVWAEKESPGYLSLLTALRNHPEFKVIRQVGGEPVGDFVVVYGSFSFDPQTLPRALFFLNPEVEGYFPSRDRKIYTASFSSADLARSFQIPSKQGGILIRRYQLLDSDRFENLLAFADGAPALLSDRQTKNRHWILPFDLEDLTTDLSLEPTFIPFLFDLMDRWQASSQTADADRQWKPVWLMEGTTKPTRRVLEQLQWPGIYASAAGALKYVAAVDASSEFLTYENPKGGVQEIEEKISLRDKILRFLGVSVLLEVLLCLLPLLLSRGGFLWPRRRALSLFLGVVGGLGILSSAQAGPLVNRPIPIGVWQGMDADRVQALEQIIEDAKQLSNLDFDRPQVVAPKDFWKYALIVFSSSKPLPALSNDERDAIRDYCDRGGLIVFDDPLAQLDSSFYRSVKEQMSKVFPSRDMSRVNREDVLFRTFYLLNEVSGRKLASPDIEGIAYDKRWVVIFSFNDLLGANLRSARGDYAYSVVPYGISQRQLATRLFVNFLMYSVTLNYKDDAIHLPHILKRRVR